MLRGIIAIYVQQFSGGNSLTLGLSGFLSVGRKKAIICCWLVAASCCLFPAANAASYESEEVKAAYLLQFLYFIEWPQSGQLQNTSPAENEVAVCVLNDDPVYQTLRANEGTVINQRRISVSSIAIDSLIAAELDAELLGQQLDILFSDCDVIYFGDLEEREISRFLGSTNNAAKLMIAENSSFLARGGMINFHRRDTNIRFDINLLVIEEAGLEVRSRLLNTAENVIDE